MYPGEGAGEISTYLFKPLVVNDPTAFLMKDQMDPAKEAGIQGGDYWHHGQQSASPEVMVRVKSCLSARWA